MKKVLAITLMLLLCATVAMAANQESWRINIKGDSGAGMDGASGASLGVYPTSSDEWDFQDGTSPYGGVSADLPGTNVHTVAVVPGKADVYPKSIKAPTMPNPEKTWDVYMAAGPSAEYSSIRVLAVTYPSALPTPEFDGVPVKYFLQMVDNKGMAGAPANGTEWELPIPTAHSTAAFWTSPVNLPIVKMPYKTNEALVAAGYRFRLIQRADVVVPEPSSLLALGTGIMGLAGFVTRRRRA